MDRTSGSVRDAVFGLLRSFGATTIFGNPGSTELPMFRNFPDDFRYVLGLQESVVVAMADGFAQASGTAALVNLHSAAGTGHALGSIFTAYRNNAPVVITAGQQARSMLPCEPFLFAQQATEFPKPYVKWACEPARAEDVPAAIARAFHISLQPPAGPTFVSIPVDDWDRPCEAVAPRPVVRRILADPDFVQAMARALNAAASPALVVGAGAARDGAWSELVRLAELQRATVWMSPMASRNAFPEDHPNFAGFLPASREGIVAAFAGHDCIVATGGPMFVYHVEGKGPYLPDGARLFHVGDDPSVASWLPAGHAAVGNVADAARALVAASAARPDRLPPRHERAAGLSGERFTDAYVLQQIAAHRPPDGIIVEEAPSSRPAMHRHLPMIARDGFFTCASGGLGYGLPAAVGVALAQPERKVIAVLGDGSTMYGIQGLWTAARLGLPITFVILNNGAYRALDSFGRHFGLDEVVGTELPGLDFCRIAEGTQIRSERVCTPAALDRALPRAFAAPGPTLIEVAIEDEGDRP